MQESRRVLLRDYWRLRCRSERMQYVLPQDILQELSAKKDSLTSCALDAPDTFRSVSSDLSVFLSEVGEMLDYRDAQPGRKRARQPRPFATPEYQGGASSSGSERERPQRPLQRSHDSQVESQGRSQQIQEVQNGSPGVSTEADAPFNLEQEG